MVRSSYHYFLQNCDVGRIQVSEPACFSKIAILVCVLQKTPLLFKEEWHGEAMTGLKAAKVYGAKCVYL
jgi:hypothetical protein